MALDKNVLSQNIYSMFKSMGKIKSNGDEYFANQLGKFIQSYVSSGILNTKSDIGNGVSPSGAYYGITNNATISVDSSFISKEIMTTFKNMIKIKTDLNLYMAKQFGKIINDAFSLAKFNGKSVGFIVSSLCKIPDVSPIPIFDSDDNIIELLIIYLDDPSMVSEMVLPEVISSQGTPITDVNDVVIGMAFKVSIPPTLPPGTDVSFVTPEGETKIVATSTDVSIDGNIIGEQKIVSDILYSAFKKLEKVYKDGEKFLSDEIAKAIDEYTKSIKIEIIGKSPSSFVSNGLFN